MIVFVDWFVILLIIMIVITGIIGQMSSIVAGLMLFSSIIISIFSTLICIMAIVKEETNSKLAIVRKILQVIFCVCVPILMLVYYLMGGQYLTKNQFMEGAIIYQNPKIFLHSAFMTIGIDIVLLIISYLSVFFEKEKKSKMALLTNYIIIALIILIPYIGLKMSYSSKISYCKTQDKQECTIKTDDKIVAAFTINYKKDTIDVTPVVLKFLNRKVVKGETLYKTGNDYIENENTFVEVYNDSTWGFINEKSIE